MLNELFRQRDLVFLDLEFSSLKPDADILEIGGLIVNHRNFEIDKEFFYRIKPQNIELADKESLKMVGYTPKKWQKAKNLNEVLSEILPLIKNKIMVGFNLAMDYARLEKAFAEAGFYFDKGKADPFYRRRLDVLSMAYLKLKDEEKIKYFSLRELCKFYHIKIPKEHNALEDARATYFLFKKLIEL